MRQDLTDILLSLPVYISGWGPATLCNHEDGKVRLHCPNINRCFKEGTKLDLYLIAQRMEGYDRIPKRANSAGSVIVISTCTDSSVIVEPYEDEDGAREPAATFEEMAVVKEPQPAPANRKQTKKG